MSVPLAIMRRPLALLLLIPLCGGCKKDSSTTNASTSSPVQQGAAKPAEPAKPKIEACTLVTPEEVGAIQGATITDAKSSPTENGNLLVSQCYYSSKEPNMSVSVALTQAAKSSSQNDVTNYWAENFGRSKAGSTGEGQPEANSGKGGGERDEDERRTPPKKVNDIGDEAYWLGNRVGGALYVLKAGVILRVSVGGPGTEETRIEKSKALAEKALNRL
jgi:hypothetical protein